MMGEKMNDDWAAIERCLSSMKAAAIQTDRTFWREDDDTYRIHWLDVLENCEKLCLKIRRMCPGITRNREIPEDAQRIVSNVLGIDIQYQEEEGWYRITLPILLPKKTERTSMRWLTEPIQSALNHLPQENPRFTKAHVAFLHHYHLNPVRDSDNIECKRVLDVLSNRFLIDDDGLSCRITHAAFHGPRDETVIYIMPAEKFLLWATQFLAEKEE